MLWQFFVNNKSFFLSKNFLLIIIILKLICAGLFSSDYTDLMFKPFVATFINGKIDPWQYYLNNKLLPSFPYMPLMLFIMSIGGILVKIFSFLPIFFINILFKLPLLGFDLLCYYFILKILPEKKHAVNLLYFSSPIMFYSTYMHGQLDIIPTALLCGSIYYFCYHNSLKANINGVLFLLAGLMTKLHLLAVLPLLFIYLTKKYNFQKAALLILTPLIALVILILPFLSEGFLKLALFNTEQAVLLNTFVNISGLKLYVTVIAMLYVFLIALRVITINKDLLICFCGLLFSIFIIFAPPMPGRIIWLIPFMTYFFVNSSLPRFQNISLYLTFNLVSLVYFFSFHHSGFVDLYFNGINLNFIKTTNEVFINVAFTLFISTLTCMITSMYYFGINSNSFYKRKNTPLVIGISGDSGTGKSTMLSTILNIIGENNILQIEGDGDHKWVRDDKMWNTYSHLNPKSNFLYKQAEDIKKLKMGMHVLRIDYDHTNGNFTVQKCIYPKKYIIISGLHVFYLPQMRNIVDIKIYMDTDEKLRRYWKIKRDISKRGYSQDKIIEQIEKRLPDAQKYILPQKDFSDLIINYYSPNLTEPFDETKEISLGIRLSINSSINIDELLNQLFQLNIQYTHDYSEDLKYQILIINSVDSLNNINYNQLAMDLIPNIDELILVPPCWSSGFEGFIQLVVLLLVSDKMRGETMAWK